MKIKDTLHMFDNCFLQCVPWNSGFILKQTSYHFLKVVLASFHWGFVQCLDQVVCFAVIVDYYFSFNHTEINLQNILHILIFQNLKLVKQLENIYFINRLWSSIKCIWYNFHQPMLDEYRSAWTLNSVFYSSNSYSYRISIAAW